MKETFYISAFCRLKEGKVNVNHSITFSEEQALKPEDFLRAAYKHYQLSYSKFYKMDGLCKLGFVASELLMRNNNLCEKYKSEDIAIILSNNSSSLDVDTLHQHSISDSGNYFPSPSVFVYTLPNILVGEIAIRNKIKGENTFFIFDKFDPAFMCPYVNYLLATGKAEACIAGWVEYYGDSYEAFLYTVERTEGVLKTPHTKEELINLYNNKQNNG
jgi:hypothetical protein